MNQNQEPIQEPQEPQKNERLVRGYGVLFDHESRDLGGFTEVISREAIDMALVDNSDIKVYLDHNRDRGILARRNKGNGSLSVSIDEKGVVYEFEAPNTALGDEVLEGLNRGDYSESSFAFTVRKDHWEKVSDGMYKRTILEIDQLYDFSIVADAAYSDTYVSVAKRSLCDYLKEEYKNADEETLKTAIESRSLPNEVKDFCEDKLEELRKAASNKDNKKDNIMAETKFSLLKAINDVANNRPLDERSIEVINEGRAEMRKAGQNYSGQIVMPIEQRAGIVQAGVDNLGGVTVQEDKLNVLDALRAKSVLAQAGATFMTGLVGNFSVPVYSGSTVTWEGEVNPAKDGSGVFSEVKFSPKRITAYIDISKQFLLQDSTAAEEMLRRDIVNAVTEKLEKTILGADAGTATQPAGLFASATALTAVNHANIVGLEQVLEDANVGGNKKFIVSPTIKAKLKTTAIDTGSGRFLMEGNECNGYEVMATSACSGLVFGNFEELVVAQWGAFDLTVDSFTQATNGAVRLVINAYFDVKPRRAEAFAARTVK